MPTWIKQSKEQLNTGRKFLAINAYLKQKFKKNPYSYSDVSSGNHRKVSDKKATEKREN